jgi:hypothetical protein
MTACYDHFEGTAAMWAGTSPVRTDLCTCAVLGLRHWMLEDGYSHLGFDCWFDVQPVGLRGGAYESPLRIDGVPAHEWSKVSPTPLIQLTSNLARYRLLWKWWIGRSRSQW